MGTLLFCCSAGWIVHSLGAADTLPPVKPTGIANTKTFASPSTKSDLPPPSHGEGELQILRCLLKGDARACRYAYTSASDKPSAWQIAEVGCLDMKAPSSCDQLRESLANRDPGQTQAYFEQLCKQGVPGGCYNTLKALRAHVDNLDVVVPTAIYTQAAGLRDKICTDKGSAEMCEVAHQTNDEINRRHDPSLQECTLTYKYLHDRDSIEIAGAKSLIAEPHLLSNLTDQEACHHKCAGWFKDLQRKPSTDFLLRAQCLWGGHPAGPTFSQRLQVEACHPTDKSMSFEDRAYYSECYCQTLGLPQLTELTDKFGVFPISLASSPKRLGTQSWYRCSQALHYDDPVAARRDAKSCRQNLNALKQALQRIKDPAHDIELSGLECDSLRSTASSLTRKSQ